MSDMPVDRNRRKPRSRAAVAGLRDGYRRMLSATYCPALLVAAGQTGAAAGGWDNRGQGW